MNKVQIIRLFDWKMCTVDPHGVAWIAATVRGRLCLEVRIRWSRHFKHTKWTKHKQTTKNAPTSNEIAQYKNVGNIMPRLEHMIVWMQGRKRWIAYGNGISTIVKTAHFTFCQVETENINKQTEKKCSEICNETKTNAKIIESSSIDGLMHIMKRLDCHQTTAKSSPALFFSYFLRQSMSNFANYRMTKSNQTDAHFTFML